MPSDGRLTASALPMAGGLLMVGIGGFGFLVVAGHTTSAPSAAALSALYLIGNVCGPGLFAGLEQETSRVVSSGLAAGVDVRPGLRRAATVGLGLTGAALLVLLALAPLLIPRSFAGHAGLLVWLLVGVAGSAQAFLVRGILGGARRFRAYGVTLAAEGAARLLPCLAFAALGVTNVNVYGLVFAGAGGVAAAAAYPWLRPGALSLAPPAAPDQTAVRDGSMAEGAEPTSAALAGPADVRGGERVTIEPIDAATAGASAAAGSRAGGVTGVGAGSGDGAVTGATAAAVGSRTGGVTGGVTGVGAGLGDGANGAEVIGPRVGDRVAGASAAGPAGATATGPSGATAAVEAGQTLRSIARGVGLLGVATLLAQLVANLAPLVVTGRMLGSPAGEAAAVAFGFAFVLTRAPLLLLGPAQAMLLPRVTAAVVRGEHDALRRQVRIGLLAVAAVGSVGAVVAAIAGPWAVQALFGAQQRPSTLVTGLLGVSTGLLLVVQLLQPVLVALGRHRTVSVAWIVGTAVLAGLLLLPGPAVTAAVIAQLTAATTVVLVVVSGLVDVLRATPAAGDRAVPAPSLLLTECVQTATERALEPR